MSVRIGTSSVVYVRFHGGRDHGGDYPLDRLEEWARRVEGWRGQGLDVYLYFNNDPGGFALKNAAALRDLIGGDF